MTATVQDPSSGEHAADILPSSALVRTNARRHLERFRSTRVEMALILHCVEGRLCCERDLTLASCFVDESRVI